MMERQFDSAMMEELASPKKTEAEAEKYFLLEYQPETRMEIA